MDGASMLNLARLNPNADVNDIGGLPDERLCVSGNYTTIAPQARRFLALLKADGKLDPGLDIAIGPDRFLGDHTISKD